MTPARELSSDRTAAARPFDPTPWREELLGFARRLGAGAEAEDVVQDAFLRAPAGEYEARLEDYDSFEKNPGTPLVVVASTSAAVVAGETTKAKLAP